MLRHTVGVPQSIRPFAVKHCQRGNVTFRYGNNSVFYKISMFHSLQLFQCCAALCAFRSSIRSVLIQGCKGFYQCAFSRHRPGYVAVRKNSSEARDLVAAHARSATAFRPARKICVIVTPFSSSPIHRRGWLRTRHRSCEDGLVLVVESCIPGGSQYKRTNTVRQIIEMKGIT